MITYKSLERSDLEAIGDLYVKAFNGPPWHDKWTKETAIKRLGQMIGCEDSYGLIAYDADKPIGMVLGNMEYFYDCTHFHLKELCVDPDIKGKGIGSKLMKEFMERLKEKKVDKLLLWTLRCSEMLSFYNKQGFKVEDDLVVMMHSI